MVAAPRTLLGSLVLLAISLLASAELTNITKAQFACVFPYVSNSKIDTYIGPLNTMFASAQINTKVQIAAFLALSGSATDNYQTFTEYTENNNLCQYYDGGCDYKGRGALMMRGGWSYRSAGNALSLSLESNPNSAATVPTVFQTAGWQWTKFLLNLNQFSTILDWTTAKLAIKLIEYQDVSELNTKALTCLTTQVPCLTYTAVEGDTWDSIATQFQVTVAALEALNPGINEPAAGQKILIDGDPASCM